MYTSFKGFVKKVTVQGERVEMTVTAANGSKGVLDAARMTDKPLVITLDEFQQELPLDEGDGGEDR